MRIESKLPEFMKEKIKKFGDVLELLAGEIERNSKMVVPHKKGMLQSSLRSKKLSNTHYQVTAGETPALAYARFQEFGGDSKRRVKNYSEPGKKAHYLGETGDKVIQRADERFKQYL